MFINLPNNQNKRTLRIAVWHWRRLCNARLPETPNTKFKWAVELRWNGEVLRAKTVELQSVQRPRWSQWQVSRAPVWSWRRSSRVQGGAAGTQDARAQAGQDSRAQESSEQPFSLRQGLLEGSWWPSWAWEAQSRPSWPREWAQDVHSLSPCHRQRALPVQEQLLKWTKNALPKHTIQPAEMTQGAGVQERMPLGPPELGPMAWWPFQEQGYKDSIVRIGGVIETVNETVHITRLSANQIRQPKRTVVSTSF